MPSRGVSPISCCPHPRSNVQNGYWVLGRQSEFQDIYIYYIVFIWYTATFFWWDSEQKKRKTVVEPLRRLQSRSWWAAPWAMFGFQKSWPMIYIYIYNTQYSCLQVGLIWPRCVYLWHCQPKNKPMPSPVKVPIWEFKKKCEWKLMRSGMNPTSG